MKIIILGAGQVGGSLAQTLINENHDITLVDLDEHCLQHFADRLDIRTIRGHCSYPGVLRQAGADGADMLIAVTDNDEANIVACQVAYTLFNVPVKMARVRSRHYFIRKDLFAPDHIPIDVLVSPELIVTELISELIKTPGALRVMSFGNGIAKMVIVKPYYGGVLLGKTLYQVYEFLSEINFTISAIYREGEQVALTPDTEIEIGDRVYFLAESGDVSSIIAAFRREEEPFKKIMIAGGGNIGGSLARVLQDDYSVKLIDHNRRRCDLLSADLRDVMVLCGDANDRGMLLEEHIENIDVFMALTNDDEANIIASIQAKQLGARQTFSLINRHDYLDILESSAINVRLSPSIATIGSILTKVRQGDIQAVYPIMRGQGEVIEGTVHGDKRSSKLVGRMIGALKLPKAISLSGIIRRERLLVPEEDITIQVDDLVIFLVNNKKHIPEVEKLFQVSSGFF